MRFTMPMLGLAGALLVGACGQQSATNNMTVNATSIGNDLALPMNDASAMESAANASTMPPPPTDNMANSADGAPLGETTGGDTGGNTVQSNVSGM
jgi:hypothetical protein